MKATIKRLVVLQPLTKGALMPKEKYSSDFINVPVTLDMIFLKLPLDEG